MIPVFQFTPSEIMTGLGTIFGGLVSTLYVVWRKWNSSGVEIVKDHAEIDVVHHLTEQRDFATAEAKESKRMMIVQDYENQASKAKIVSLESDLVTLKQRVLLLSQLVTRLTTALDLTRSQLNQILVKTTSQIEGSRATPP